MGTSLTVQPFASLPSFVREQIPRVLINLERVGSLGSRPDDVLLLGDCDAGVRKFADALGWLDELEELWKKTNPETERKKQEEPPKSRQDQLEADVEKLTRDIDTSLKLSTETNSRIRSELEKSQDKVSSKGTQPPSDILTTTQPTLSKNDSLLSHVFPHLKQDRPDKSSL
jgi:NAD-dependent histone deacetylase SIR2